MIVSHAQWRQLVPLCFWSKGIFVWLHLHAGTLLAIPFGSGIKSVSFVSQGLKDLDLYFAMARGVEGKEALDMSKFFDTNYHYMVPELDDSSSANPDFKPFLEKVSTLAHIHLSQGCHLIS